jgi:hypothetical protein
MPGQTKVLNATLSSNGEQTFFLDVEDAAPADAELKPSQFVIWLDQTNDAIKVKAKYADGSVSNGTVATLS